MVSLRDVKRSVGRAFSPAFESLSSQEREVARARQTLQQQEELIKERRSQLEQQQFVRSVGGLQEMAQRNRVLQQLSQAEVQIRERLRELPRFEQQIQQSRRELETQQQEVLRESFKPRGFVSIGQGESRAEFPVFAGGEVGVAGTVVVQGRPVGSTTAEIFTNLPGNITPVTAQTLTPATPAGGIPVALAPEPIITRQTIISPSTQAVQVQRTRQPIFSEEEGINVGELFIRGEEFLEQRITQPLGRAAARAGIPIRPSLLEPRFAAGETFKSLFFAPAFMTGTAGVVQTQIRRKSLAELFKELGDSLGSSRFATTAGNEATLRETTRELIKRAGKDPEALKRLRQFYLREGRVDLFDDIFQQEIAEINLVKQQVRKAFPKVTPVRDQPSQLIGVSVPSQFTGTGLFERTDEVGIPALDQRPASLQTNLITPRTRTLTSVGTATALSPLLALAQPQAQPQAQSPLLGQLQIQTPSFAQPQAQRQPQAQKQPQAQTPIFIQAQPQIPQLAQPQLQQPVQSLAFRPPRARPARPVRPQRPPRIPILPVLGSGVNLNQIDITSSSGTGFDVVVGMGKKTKVIAKDLPRNLALRTGLDFISSDIAASFKLKPTGKTPRTADIARVNVNSRVFRKGKKDPLRIVERRKFRLDSGKELVQIKAARKRSRRK